MPRPGPYSKEIKLAKPDMRTREGRLLKQIRAKFHRAGRRRAELGPAGVD